MKTLLRTLSPILFLSTLSLVANGQILANGSSNPPLGKVTYSFAIPQGVDPPVVIDLTSLNSTHSFTGAELLDDGVEVHGQIPGLKPGSYRDILQVQFSLYTGANSYGVNVTTTPPFVAWDESAVSTSDPNFKNVILTAALGSAPINDHFTIAPGVNSSYLVMSAAATGAPAFITALRGSTLTVKATEEGTIDRFAPVAVPEPGAIGIGFALVCCIGGSLLTKRRKA